ncbi:MAG: T9SS type A sorting domain-containing protein [Tannerella sp.]|jgi:hypothetical protein|nr:T9SS type A sorting domain-containing protein [Tannerella sp.]
MNKVKLFLSVLLLCACSTGAWAQYYVDLGGELGSEIKIRIYSAENDNYYLYEDGLSLHSYFPGYEKKITYLGWEDKLYCQAMLAQDPVLYKHLETHDYIFTLKKEGEGPNGEPMYSIYSDGTEYLDYSGGYLTDASCLAFTEEGDIANRDYLLASYARYTFTKEKMGDYSLFVFESAYNEEGALDFMIRTVAGGGIMRMSNGVPVVTRTLPGEGGGTIFVAELVPDDDPEGGNPNSVEAVSGTGIWTSGSTLHINAPSPVAVYIYSVNGSLIKTLPVGTASTVLPQGAYIVKAGAATSKVVVR